MDFQFQSLNNNIFIVDELIDNNKFYEDIIQILKDNEAHNLPAYYYNIDTVEDAKDWLEFMNGELDLFFIQGKYSQNTIGFIFIHTLPNNQSHIGYLLSKEYWNTGVITEVLMEFMKYVDEIKKWNNILAGVENSNSASIELLKKLGFILKDEGNMISLYQYKIELS